MTSVPTIQTRVSFSHRLLFSCPGQDKYCLDISAPGARGIIVRVISSEILSGSVARRDRRRRVGGWLSRISRAGQFRGSIAYHAGWSLLCRFHVSCSPGISDPFPKPSKKEDVMSGPRGGLLLLLPSAPLHPLPSFLSMDSSLISARRRADSPLGNNKLPEQPRISSANLSTDGTEPGTMRLSRTSQIISRDVYRRIRVLQRDERVHRRT